MNVGVKLVKYFGYKGVGTNHSYLSSYLQVENLCKTPCRKDVLTRLGWKMNRELKQILDLHQNLHFIF